MFSLNWNTAGKIHFPWAPTVGVSERGWLATREEPAQQHWTVFCYVYVCGREQLLSRLGCGGFENTERNQKPLDVSYLTAHIIQPPRRSENGRKQRGFWHCPIHSVIRRRVSISSFGLLFKYLSTRGWSKLFLNKLFGFVDMSFSPSLSLWCKTPASG